MSFPLITDHLSTPTEYLEVLVLNFDVIKNTYWEMNNTENFVKSRSFSPKGEIQAAVAKTSVKRL